MHGVHPGCQTVKPFPKRAEDDVTQIGKLTVSMYGDRQILRDLIENDIFIRSRTQKHVIPKYISVTQKLKY